MTILPINARFSLSEIICFDCSIIMYFLLCRIGRLPVQARCCFVSADALSSPSGASADGVLSPVTSFAGDIFVPPISPEIVSSEAVGHPA